MDANTIKDLLKNQAQGIGRDLARAVANLPLGDFKLVAEVTVKLTAEIPVLPDPVVTFAVTAKVWPTTAGVGVEVSSASIVPSVAP